MKITFLNVGQGDSIVIEWFDKTQYKIGIIDANQTGSSNPMLEYIQSKDLKEIEFIILSHPHDDHYSGLTSILEYVEHEKIIVKYFLHTCSSVYKTLILSSFRSRTDLANFDKLMALTERLHTSGAIIECAFVNNITQEFALTDTIHLKFYFPTTKFYNKFNQSAYKEDQSLQLKNNPNFNYLATIIKVYTAEWYILLTSDADIGTFDDLYSLISQGETNFIFSQLPHHGSKGNFNKQYWLDANRKGKCENAVVSFGYQNKFNHPNSTIVNSLKKYGYTIYGTNNESHSASTASGSPVSSDLDLISSLTTSQSIATTMSKGSDIIVEINYPTINISGIKL